MIDLNIKKDAVSYTYIIDVDSSLQYSACQDSPLTTHTETVINSKKKGT
jgi:hypothetical protein